jgi:MraZ protein
MYPQSAWKKVFDKVAALNEFHEEYRNFQRNFLRGSTEVELDAMGRFIIPRSMATYAGIEKDVVVVGIANRIELWEEGRYQSYLIRDMQQFSQNAQNFLGVNNGDHLVP